MQYVERLAKEIALYNERDISLRSTLSTCDDRNTTSTKCTEEFTGDTGSVLHVLTHDGDGSKSGFCMHRIHSSICNLIVELAVQYVYCFIYILLTYTDRG